MVRVEPATRSAVATCNNNNNNNDNNNNNNNIRYCDTYIMAVLFSLASPLSPFFLDPEHVGLPPTVHHLVSLPHTHP